MKTPTATGVVGIITGTALVAFSAIAGGNLIIMGIGLLFILAGGLTGQSPVVPRQPCPFCQEPVQPAATVCPHCQRDLPQAGNATCQFCGRAFRVAEAALGHVTRCPHCKKLTQAKKVEPPKRQATAGAR